MKNIFFKIILILPIILLFSSCNDENNKENLITGVWTQVAIEEDGTERNLTTDEKEIKLLIEPNGVYRSSQLDQNSNHYFGTWHITDDKWTEFTVETWKMSLNPLQSTKISDQWINMHLPVRFTIIKLTSDEMHLRIKTFIGDAKYSVLFTKPELELITDQNINDIESEFKTLRTYVFKFRKL